MDQSDLLPSCMVIVLGASLKDDVRAEVYSVVCMSRRNNTCAALDGVFQGPRGDFSSFLEEVLTACNRDR